MLRSSQVNFFVIQPLVLDFPACRDLVYEAMDYHIRPHKHQSQQPRKAIGNGNRLSSIHMNSQVFCIV